MIVKGMLALAGILIAAWIFSAVADIVRLSLGINLGGWGKYLLLIVAALLLVKFRKSFTRSH